MNYRFLFSNIGGGFIGLSFFFFYKVFDRFMNYNNGEYGDPLVNAYVGGDAYNYIINGTHATVFAILAGIFFLSGILFILFQLYLNIKPARFTSALPPVEQDTPHTNPKPEAEAFVQEYLSRQRSSDSKE